MFDIKLKNIVCLEKFANTFEEKHMVDFYILRMRYTSYKVSKIKFTLLYRSEIHNSLFRTLYLGHSVMS